MARRMRLQPWGKGCRRRWEVEGERDIGVETGIKRHEHEKINREEVQVPLGQVVVVGVGARQPPDTLIQLRGHLMRLILEQVTPCVLVAAAMLLHPAGHTVVAGVGALQPPVTLLQPVGQFTEVVGVRQTTPAFAVARTSLVQRAGHLVICGMGD